MCLPHPPTPLFGDICDDQGVIRTDLACFHCGYNLRSLHHQRPCPECGTPTARTIAHRLMRHPVVRSVTPMSALRRRAMFCGFVLGLPVVNIVAIKISPWFGDPAIPIGVAFYFAFAWAAGLVCLAMLGSEPVGENEEPVPVLLALGIVEAVIAICLNVWVLATVVPRA